MATTSKPGCPVFDGDCSRYDHHIRQPISYGESMGSGEYIGIRSDVRCRECGKINCLPASNHNKNP